ncbi:signal peptidase I [Streptomyces sp. NBC_01351]|uniref:signal peptidase I n=1 Tax=Streptomyces sp. NBC_01351 TaxID=2903833 RepID=UPI002E3385F8|nr:signal peptidase I [Streptomyces sp. NBC_01351]
MERRPGRRLGIARTSVVAAGALALAVTTVVQIAVPLRDFNPGKHFGVAMEPTYHDGDLVFFEPVSPEEVRRGDVVLASVPWFAGQYDVSRVVAVAGDRISYKIGDAALTLNEEPLNEPYLHDPKTPSTVPFEVTVPVGHVFLMSDHRENSTGSQFADNGPVAAFGVTDRVVTRPPALLVAMGQLAGAGALLVGILLHVLAWVVRRRAEKAAAALGTAS